MDFPQHGRSRVRTGAGCSGCLALPLSLGMTCGIGALVFGGIELSRQSSDAAAVAAIGSCPAITAALGAPIVESTVSTGCGESESGGGVGHAQWGMSIRGPRGSASAWYAAHYTGGGPWIVDSATVTLGDGRTLTAVPCDSAPAEPPRRERERDGKGKRR